MPPDRIRVATFDCYGTLVDWEGGLGSFLYDKALRSRAEPLVPGRELRERWEAIQFELISGEYRRYRDILADSVRLLCEERGWPYEESDGRAIVRAIRSWQPFPETRAALHRARAAGLRLVIVSNTDRDIIKHTLPQLEVPFDDVQVAEDVHAYKPADEVFTRALERIGDPPESVLHVAFGFKYDIDPAARAGMHTAWVNRHGEERPGATRPDHEWRDLWGLADFAESSAI